MRTSGLALLALTAVNAQPWMDNPWNALKVVPSDVFTEGETRAWCSYYGEDVDACAASDWCKDDKGCVPKEIDDGGVELELCSEDAENATVAKFEQCEESNVEDLPAMCQCIFDARPEENCAITEDGETAPANNAILAYMNFMGCTKGTTHQDPCMEITDPCECRDTCGWSSESGECTSDSETRCWECESMEGCEAGTCAAESFGCAGFEATHVCQCNDSCVEYDNCCSDYMDECGPFADFAEYRAYVKTQNAGEFECAMALGRFQEKARRSVCRAPRKTNKVKCRQVSDEGLCAKLGCDYSSRKSRCDGRPANIL